jgi:hypothetical protein
MPNYTFTVRAIDDKGAFADQNFSITVQNTKIERFVAITNLNAYTSQDGITWTYRQGLGGSDIVYGGGSWMIIRANDYLHSNDGIVWEPRSFPGGGILRPANGYYTHRPNYTNGKWYVMGSNGTLYISSDAKNWTSSSDVTGYNSSVCTKMVLGDKMVEMYRGIFADLTYSSYNSFKAGSDDGNGSYSMSDITFKVGSNSTYQAADFTYYNGMWLLADELNVRILYSYNLVNWQTATTPAFYNATSYSNRRERPYRFTIGNGIIIMGVSSDHTNYVWPSGIYRSVNGRDWTKATVPGMSLWSGPQSHVTQQALYTGFSNGVFVAAGQGVVNSSASGFWYSTDGTNWAMAALPLYDGGMVSGLAARNE